MTRGGAIPLYILRHFFFLYFIVFIPKFYKRQAKMYHNTSFTILTQKRIRDEKKKKMKREREEERKQRKRKSWRGRYRNLLQCE